MALSERDRRALKTLAVAAPVILVVFYGGPLLNSLTAGSTEYSRNEARFLPLYQKMKAYPAWDAEVRKRQKQLRVRINHDPADRQKDAFVKALEDLASKSKVRIYRPRWLKVTRKSAGARKLAYQIDATGSFEDVIKFIQGIEALTVPTVVEEINIAKRTTSSKEKKPTVSATLRLQTYIFPEDG
jgi:Tfp pilus assembly protein PilO